MVLRIRWVETITLLWVLLLFAYVAAFAQSAGLRPGETDGAVYLVNVGPQNPLLTDNPVAAAANIHRPSLATLATPAIALGPIGRRRETLPTGVTFLGWAAQIDRNRRLRKTPEVSGQMPTEQLFVARCSRCLHRRADCPAIRGVAVRPVTASDLTRHRPLCRRCIHTDPTPATP